MAVGMGEHEKGLRVDWGHWMAGLLLLVLILGSLVFELGTALFAGLVEVELVKF